MTATEELRRMLDERGVKWIGTDFAEPTNGHPTNTSLGSEHHDAVFIEGTDGSVLRLFDLTPEQAIAATLGAGTCCDEGTFNSWRLFTCSHCSVVFQLDAIRDAPSIGRVIPPRFCPNCGRRVVDE